MSPDNFRKRDEKIGQWLPETALEDIRKHVVAIKGPLTPPVGKGMRSARGCDG